jgi:hypothetical protein
MLSSTLECGKIPFFLSKHPLESLDQEDRVMKRNPSSVMKHNPILQDAMSPTRKSKSDMGDYEVSSYHLLQYPVIPVSWYPCRFLALLPFCKSQDEIYF